MKNIVITDNCNPKFAYNLSKKYNLGIEVQSFHDPYILETNPNLKTTYKELFKNFNYSKSIHAPFWELNLGSKMREITEVTIKMFDFTYTIAKELGCTDIIVHNGYIPNTSWESAWIERASEKWISFLESRNDINFYIENQFELNSSIICKLVDKVNLSNFKACLDIGHVNAHSEESLINWIENLGNRIGYVHLHNNNGKIDEHNGLDKGSIEISSVLENLENHSPNAIWCLETCESDIESSYLILEKFIRL